MSAKNLATALAAVQAKLPKVDKGKTADTGSYRYKYAGLDDVAHAVYPLLAGEGLAFTAKPTLHPEFGFVLHYALHHGESGETDEGFYPLLDPSRATAQQIGSALTYARRYTLCSVVGVVPDEDDDGQAVGDAKPAPRRQRQSQPEPPPANEPVEVDHEWVEAWLTKLDLVSSKGEMTGMWAEMIAAGRARKIDDDTRALLTERFGARSKELGLSKDAAA